MEAYIVKHKSDLVRAKSRSGGMFTALSDVVLKNGGVVYGCRLNENLCAVHDRAETPEERDAFRGSKYVQSNLSGCFQRISEDLQAGRQVLFSGTPCQVAGLRKYCEKLDSSNLICIDIACHGVPKEAIWKKYLDYARKKYKGNITAVNFRNKNRYGWASHVETFTVNGKEYDSKEYADLFYQRLLLGKGCFQCKHKSLERVGDVTLADAWGGITEEEKRFNDNKGLSLVLVSSDKGRKLFDSCVQELQYEPCDIEHYMQLPFMRNFDIPKNYDEFWKDEAVLDYGTLYKKYCNVPRVKRILRQIRYCVKSRKG